MMKNVEKMLNAEKAAAKATAKKGAKLAGFDLNTGQIGNVGGAGKGD